jgi:ubiquitin-like protein Pup
MPGQEQQRPVRREDEPDEAPGAVPQGAATKEGLDDDIYSVLDEIDDVLETNAEDFVRAFVQKGGQ